MHGQCEEADSRRTLLTLQNLHAWSEQPSPIHQWPSLCTGSTRRIESDDCRTHTFQEGIACPRKESVEFVSLPRPPSSSLSSSSFHSAPPCPSSPSISFVETPTPTAGCRSRMRTFFSRTYFGASPRPSVWTQATSPTMRS